MQLVTHIVWSEWLRLKSTFWVDYPPCCWMIEFAEKYISEAVRLLEEEQDRMLPLSLENNLTKLSDLGSDSSSADRPR